MIELVVLDDDRNTHEWHSDAIGDHVANIGLNLAKDLPAGLNLEIDAEGYKIIVRVDRSGEADDWATRLEVDLILNGQKHNLEFAYSSVEGPIMADYHSPCNCWAKMEDLARAIVVGRLQVGDFVIDNPKEWLEWFADVLLFIRQEFEDRQQDLRAFELRTRLTAMDAAGKLTGDVIKLVNDVLNVVEQS